MSGQRLAAILGAVEASIRQPQAVRAPPCGPLPGEVPLATPDAEALGTLDDLTYFVYRRLVRGTLASAIRLELPRTAAILGARFDADVDVFLSTHGSRSHYLRDVAFELVASASASWRADASVPPFVPDLARHELSAFRAAAAALRSRGAQPVTPDLDLAAPVVFDEAVALERYDYPVHEIGDDDRSVPARPTRLLVYRDAELDVRYLALSAIAATIVEELLPAGDRPGRPLGEALRSAAAREGLALGPALLEQTATLLADLAERGALLGRPAESKESG